MILQCFCEFRGSSSKVNSKTGNTYYYVNLEDETGEGWKFNCSDDVELKQLKKGDKATFLIDYDVTYKSLKVVGFKK